MDLEDDLDFDEDGLEDITVEFKNNDIKVLGLDDEYLQLDCSEEEEIGDIKETLETDTLKTNSVERQENQTDKGNEESSEKLNSFTEKDQNKSLEKTNGNNFNSTVEKARGKRGRRGRRPNPKNKNWSWPFRPVKRAYNNSGFSHNIFKGDTNHGFNVMYPPLLPEYNRNNNCGNNYQNNCEVEGLDMKKLARLIRFSNDGLINQKKEQNCSLPAGKSYHDWDFSNEYFEKMEEQKLVRDKIMKLKEKNRNFSKEFGTENEDWIEENPPINKESLMKKENPFDTSSQITQNDGEMKGKRFLKTQGGRFEGKFVNPFNSKLSAKNPQESGVKGAHYGGFSDRNKKKIQGKPLKSCDKFRSARAGCPGSLESCHLPASFFGGIQNEAPNVSFLSQVGSQLTGCIVKVLNIPPSTTVKDVLALAGPIGKIMEMKLNFPKENSAVIRFADPVSAENFFSLYHGQKVKNYFLNVIVI